MDSRSQFLDSAPDRCHNFIMKYMRALLYILSLLIPYLF
ncbi:MAG: hypothetical protein H6Q38_1335 [Chloroflexi bacterium]|nr:hypothetical protein [Chloroflexota bacterium]